MSKFKLFIKPPSVQGQDEDFVELAVDGDRKLITFVTKRDVDEQHSKPTGLNQSDFEHIEDQPFEGDVTKFQELVNEHFSGLDVANWFKLGLEGQEEEC